MLDDPLITYEGTSRSSNNAQLHYTDPRGSVVHSAKRSAAQATNSYDEFGIPGEDNAGRFQYTGQVWIPEIGMYYYKARMYSPTLGRFLQPDPIGYGDGLNIYNYVGGDPVNNVDPTGLCSYTNWNHYWIPRYSDGTEGEPQLYDTSVSLDGCDFDNPGVIATGGNSPQFGDGGSNGILVTGTAGHVSFANSPFPHVTPLIDLLSHCSADRVFSALLEEGGSAPGAPAVRPDQLNTTREISLSSIFTPNVIFQTIDAANRKITNRTREGHIFHDGSVTLQVFQREGGGSRLLIQGYGVNKNPLLAIANTVGGYGIFITKGLSAVSSCGIPGWAP